MAELQEYHCTACDGRFQADPHQGHAETCKCHHCESGWDAVKICPYCGEDLS
jgi:hypothetical protein